MKFEEFLEEYIKSNADGNEAYKFILAGCVQLYEVTQKQIYKETVLRFMQDWVNTKETSCKCGGTKVLNSGYLLFFAHKETNALQYQEAIMDVMNQLSTWKRTENGIFAVGETAEAISPKTAYQIYPFYMKCETKYHNKADYQDIIRQLWRLADTLSGDEETCWYLMTLVDVMDSMSIEIFEHYKSLEGVFKETIKRMIKSGQSRDFVSKESAMMAYSILKACNMGILNSEKYAGIGRSIIDGMIESPLKQEDAVATGLKMMAYAQTIQFNNREV